MTKKEEIKEANKFSKTQIVKSKTYENYCDFLNGVLGDKKQYTKEEINRLIKEVK